MFIALPFTCLLAVIAMSKFRRNLTLFKKQLSDFSAANWRYKQSKADRPIRLFAI